MDQEKGSTDAAEKAGEAEAVADASGKKHGDSTKDTGRKTEKKPLTKPAGETSSDPAASKEPSDAGTGKGSSKSKRGEAAAAAKKPTQQKKRGRAAKDDSAAATGSLSKEENRSAKRSRKQAPAAAVAAAPAVAQEAFPHAAPQITSYSTTNEAKSMVMTYLLEQGRTLPNGKVQPTHLRIQLNHSDDNNNNNPSSASDNDEPDEGGGTKQEIRLQMGDDILLCQDDDSSMQGQRWPPARITQFIERPAESPGEQPQLLFTCQWFLSKQDIAQLPIGAVPWEGPLTQQQLMDSMSSENEIVLSNHEDENDIGAILGLARIKFATEDDPDEPEPEDEETVANLGGPLYFCRYQLEVTAKRIRLSPYTETAAAAATTGSHGETGGARRGDDTTSVQDDDEMMDSGVAPDDMSHDDVDDDLESHQSGGARAVAGPAAVEGEGSVLRESIEVGPEHQAVVPAFDPNAKAPASRRPRCVWKPGMYSDEQLSQFLHGVAQRHTPFLVRNRLSPSSTTTVSVAPILDTDKNVDDPERQPRLTGSSLSTASMLGGGEKTGPGVDLRKECDVDALLELLTESNGDVQKAIDAASLDLDRITTRGAWTQSEKNLYNDGFRRHAAALRDIAKTMAPVRSMKDVVDYHFRFKIPDQFRQYQETKREIAVRIVECLEEKRQSGGGSHRESDGHEERSRRPSPPPTQLPQAQNQQRQQQHWSETSVQDIAVYTEARRRKARQLMLDVQAQLGNEVLAEVAHLIRQMIKPPPTTLVDDSADTEHQNLAEAREALLAALEGHSMLQQGFVEFLPKPKAASPSL